MFIDPCLGWLVMIHNHISIGRWDIDQLMPWGLSHCNHGDEPRYHGNGYASAAVHTHTDLHLRMSSRWIIQYEARPSTHPSYQQDPTSCLLLGRESGGMDTDCDLAVVIH